MYFLAILSFLSQVTAPSISEPHCKAALLNSADLLSAYSQELATAWKPLLQEPKHQKQATALQKSLEPLEAQIEALRKACAQSEFYLFNFYSYELAVVPESVSKLTASLFQ